LTQPLRSPLITMLIQMSYPLPYLTFADLPFHACLGGSPPPSSRVMQYRTLATCIPCFCKFARGFTPLASVIIHVQLFSVTDRACPLSCLHIEAIFPFIVVLLVWLLPSPLAFLHSLLHS
jgi:hypothetical protein